MRPTNSMDCLTRRRLVKASMMIRVGSLAAIAGACLSVACEGRGGAARDAAKDLSSTITIGYCCGVEDVLNAWEDMSARRLIFVSLAQFNERGELESRLARSWEHSPDYREWTYHLRTDVRWDDGVPFTAHDVKFTLDLLSHPDVAYMNNVEVVTALDDSTVIVRFRGYRGFFEIAALFYPKHLLQNLEPKKIAEWNFWNHPVGNGPYRFSGRLPKTMWEFEASPTYYGATPRIKRVRLKLLGAASLTGLLAGEVDAVTFGNPASIAKIQRDERFRVYHRLFELVSRAIYWNNAHPFLADTRVRRALTLAIDRRALLDVLNLPRDFPVFDGVYTDRQLRRGELPPALPYDPEEARRLLEQTGWHDRDGDGLREKEGKPFRFMAIYPSAAGFDEMAVFVQDQLRRVGVSMELQALESGGAISERLRGGKFDAAFQAFRNEGWYFEQFFGPGSPIDYHNTALLPLIEKTKAAADPDERDRLYRQMSEILRADLPVPFLHPRVETYFAHRRVKGLSTPFHADPVWYMEDLWVEEDVSR